MLLTPLKVMQLVLKYGMYSVSIVVFNNNRSILIISGDAILIVNGQSDQ